MSDLVFSTLTSPINSEDDSDFTLGLSFRISNDAVVVRDITAGKRGRIHYQSTDWFARAINNLSIPSGTVVHLLKRDGNTWLVESERPQSPVETGW